MESINVCLSGHGAALNTNFNPEIELDGGHEYSCCLLDFSIQTSQLWARIDEERNMFPVFYPPSPSNNWIRLPNGTYPVELIAGAVEYYMPANLRVRLRFDKYTMKYRIETDAENRIGFSHPTSIGWIFGFAHKDLENKTRYDADYRLGVPDIETIRINCDLMANGSFHNGASTTVLHEFRPKPHSDYKTIEQPQRLIYSPVIKRCISSISITVTDQNGELIDIPRAVYRCRINIKRE